MDTVTITSKNQITLPSSIVRKMGISAADRSLVIKYDQKLNQLSLMRPVSGRKIRSKIIKQINDAAKYNQSQLRDAFEAEIGNK